MKRLFSVVLAAGLLLAGCSGDDNEPPPPPANVAALDPCTLLTDAEQAELKVRVRDRAEEGHRRTCSFIGTDLVNDPGEVGLGSLELTIPTSIRPARTTRAPPVPAS